MLLLSAAVHLCLSCIQLSISWQTTPTSLTFSFTANEFNYDTPAWLGEHTLDCAFLLVAVLRSYCSNTTAKKAGAPCLVLLHTLQILRLPRKLTTQLFTVFEELMQQRLRRRAMSCTAAEILQQTEGTELYQKD